MTDINSFTQEIDNFKENLERRWEEAEQSIVRGEQEDWNQGLLRFLNSNTELFKLNSLSSYQHISPW